MCCCLAERKTVCGSAKASHDLQLNLCALTVLWVVWQSPCLQPELCWHRWSSSIFSRYVGGWGGGQSLQLLVVMSHLCRPGIPVTFSQLTCTLTSCTHIYTPPLGRSRSFLPGLADYTLLCSHASQSQEESNLKGCWESPGLAISGPFFLLALHFQCLTLSSTGWSRQETQPSPGTPKECTHT